MPMLFYLSEDRQGQASLVRQIKGVSRRFPLVHADNIWGGIRKCVSVTDYRGDKQD